MGFDPASLAIAATLASTAVGAAGQIGQSRANAAAAGYNAKVAAQNAQLATQNANYVGAQGEQNVAAEGAKTRAGEGAITASQGASGVKLNSGSSVDVRESAAKIGMLNALNVRSQAARQAYGYQTQAVSDTAQSQLYRSQQKADKESGIINAGATILGGIGAASAYSKFLATSDPTSGLTNLANEDTQAASPVGAATMSQLYPQF